MTPATVTLYRAPTTVCDVDALAEWLADRIDPSVQVRDRFVSEYGDSEALAGSFARARVISPYDRETGSEMLGIKRYEERVLAEPDRGGGVLYDGFQIQRAFNRALPKEERSLSHLHIPVLDRVLATWGDHDGRWHKRIAVLGQPTLLSIPGLYEAPAKPEAYYQEQQRHALVTGDTPPREVLESELELDMLVEDDPRTTEAMKGYVLAAYHLVATGEGFCAAEECRLSNPHRHAELIRSHLEAPAFCAEHRNIYGRNEEG